MKVHYHNTNGISGLQLEIQDIKANSLSEMILRIFSHNKDQKLTPYQMLAMLEANGVKTLITSVRRSLSDLTEENKLYKSPKADAKGPFHLPNHTWSLQPYNEEKEAA